MDSNLKQSLARLMARYNTIHINSTDHDNRYYTKLQTEELMSGVTSASALDELRQELINEVARATSVENLKAPLNSPAFEGIPVGATASLGNSTRQLATTEFVQMSVDDKILNSDAMIIKGTLGDDGTVTELPTVYKTGWTYRIITAGTYAGQVCEIGDMITAFVSREEEDTPEDSDWVVNQTNIDGAITDTTNKDGYIVINRNNSSITIDHSDITTESSTSSESLNFGATFSVLQGAEVDPKGHITKLLTTSFTLPSYQIATESVSGLTRLYTTSGDNSNGTMTQKAITEYVSEHTHLYAGSSTAGGDATNALKLNGYPLSIAGSKSVWGTVPSIGSGDGVMEVGKYIDFHSTSASTVDYDVRITADTTGLTISGTTKGAFSGSLSGNATTSSSCTGNANTATALTTSAGSSTKPVYFSGGKPVECSYTLGAACAKAVTDSSSASAIGTGSSLVTERDVYYGLPNINGVHTYTSGTSIYAPTSVGTSGYILKSGGSGAPSWVAQSTLTAGAATKLATARTLTIGNTGKTFDGSGNVSWSLSEIGAAASSHSHSYIPLSGSTTITGALKWNGSNHGISVSTSHTQIGDLSGNNGGYTQVMNDCVAEHTLLVKDDVTVTTDSDNSTYGKAAINIANKTSGSSTIFPAISFMQINVSDANLVMKNYHFYRKTGSSTTYSRIYDSGNNTVDTYDSAAIGTDNTLSGNLPLKFAFGGDNTVTGGYGSAAIGTQCKVNGQHAIATGDYSESNAWCTVAMGDHVLANGAGQTVFGHFNVSNTSGSTGGTTGHALIVGNGTSATARSNAFRVTYAGLTYAKGAYSSTGADYAEYFEWEDGNPNNEDRRGLFVTFAGGNKIRIANATDKYILGAVSGKPVIIGNTDDDDQWAQRFLKDEYGEFIMQQLEKEREVKVIDNETGEEKTEIITENVKFYVENPEYDPSREYVTREQRPEWSPIGMLGVLSVHDDGSCVVNGYCKCSDNGIATMAERSVDTYRVIERVTDNIIRVVIK